MALVGKHVRTFEYYMKDPDFNEKVRVIRRKAKGRGPLKLVPGFETFSEEYMGQRVFRHQLQWIDLLEGHTPRERHPS